MSIVADKTAIQTERRVSMNKWCIVGVYFGKLPNYFGLWLKSAQKNTEVDFLIFTDQEIKQEFDNIRFVNFTIQEMQKLSSRKLGFEVYLERPYKCCDLKPAYGVIFEEYLTAYSYWGHCDFDLIWGDLGGYFNKYHLESYDKFLPLGHLSMYRNTCENNRRFMLDGASFSYRTVFTKASNYAFDELGGVYRIFVKHGYKTFDKRIFADISKIYRRFKLARNDRNYNYQVFCWNNGHVYRYYYDQTIKRDEFIYIHFKERGFLPFDADCIRRDSFYITNQGFYSCDPVAIDINEIQKYNSFESADIEKIELRRFIWSERKRKIIGKINRMLHRKGKIR